MHAEINQLLFFFVFFSCVAVFDLVSPAALNTFKNHSVKRKTSKVQFQKKNTTLYWAGVVSVRLGAIAEKR